MIYGDLVWTPGEGEGGRVSPSQSGSLTLKWPDCVDITLIPRHCCCHQSPLADWLRSTAGVIVGELLGESDRDNRELGPRDTCPGIGGTRVLVTATDYVSALISDIVC